LYSSTREVKEDVLFEGDLFKKGKKFSGCGAKTRGMGGQNKGIMEIGVAIPSLSSGRKHVTLITMKKATSGGGWRCG